MPYSRKPNESGKSDTTEIPILRKRRFAKCNNGKLDTHLFFDHILLLHQLNLELSAGDKSSHTVSLNLEIHPVFLRFSSRIQIHD